MSSKSKIKITPGAVVCQEAELKGEVTIAAKTVVHPKARIIAEKGPIVIGEGNLIEEQTLICNSSPGKTMIIGNYNVFEIGSQCEALSIGNNNVLETKSKVGCNVGLTNGCVIGAMCEVNSNEKLSENTVIYGHDVSRRIASEMPAPQLLQLDFLTKILPNYHHLKKPHRS
eukprot:gene18888-20790_t